MLDSCTHVCLWYLENSAAILKAMLHEAIFLATCNATSCKLQGENSRVTPHFETAIVAMRVARKGERPSTFRNVARQLLAHNISNLHRNFVRMGQLELIFRSREILLLLYASCLFLYATCLLLYALQVAKNVANV